MSFLSCEEMLAAARSQNISLSEAILRSDLAESRLTEAHSREMMHHLWQVMQATCVITALMVTNNIFNVYILPYAMLPIIITKPHSIDRLWD